MCVCVNLLESNKVVECPPPTDPPPLISRFSNAESDDTNPKIGFCLIMSVLLLVLRNMYFYIGVQVTKRAREGGRNIERKRRSVRKRERARECSCVRVCACVCV